MRSQRIFKNTLALYARQILVIVVNLYTLRVVLNVLGIDDYGIYSVVAGVVTLCAFLPTTMASATQRFFSFALGVGDKGRLEKTFSVNWMIYAVIAIFALLTLETIGLWFVEQYLIIPNERFDAARTLYHFTVFGFIASIFCSPFMAILIAHEDIHIYAWLSIVEALMKLAIVFALTDIAWDKLELYGGLLLIVGIINTAAYIAVCVRKYPECQFRKMHWDKPLFKEIIDFTGWTLFGQITTVARNQAVTILLNQMFNPATVAARAISMTVANQVIIFATNFNTGLYPPIVKSWAANEKKEMYSLVFNGSKLTFFLMWIFALPMLLEMEHILKIWLGVPPRDAIFFTQLGLIEMLIFSLSLPITTAARAPGQMKSYELILGAMQIGIFLGSWVVLEMGFPAYAVFVVAIVINILMFVVRLLIVGRLTNLNTKEFFERVLRPVLLVVALSALPSALLKCVLPDGIGHAALLVLLSMLLSSISMYKVGLDDAGRAKAKEMLERRLKNAQGKR